MAYILENGLAASTEILAVTFTNKAANEMRQRVEAQLSRPVEGLWLGTFHAVAVRILRRHAELVGLQSTFTILDTDDQQRLLKQILTAEDIDEKRYPPKLVAAVISRWKDRALTPDRVTASESRGHDLILKVYRHYQERLKTLNACDFGDLLLHCIHLFQTHSAVLETYQQQFRYILVDEYQDTNIAQYLWLQVLAQKHRNICCVGDDDQSIYGWRGAEVGNILRFEQDFPGAKVVRLEQNYRSTAHILGAASGLIAKNQGRLGKTLWTSHSGGEKVLVRATWDSEDEARIICDFIEGHYQRNTPLSHFAILVRAGFQTREFEDRLLTLGLPYRVIGGLRFYERLEIRDALAYFRIVVQPHDGLAFERIVNVPKRGIGSATLQLIHAHAREQSISVPQAALALSMTDEIRGVARTNIQHLFEDITRWRQQLDSLSPTDLAKIILDESGYAQMWLNDKSVDAPGRLENLKELVSALEGFDSLINFLEHISLVMSHEQASSDAAVSLMTLHAAKGLEFDTVFLPAWEENLFPHQRSLEDSGVAGLEEERRLAYVGLTRAKRQAIVTYAQHRRMHQGWQLSSPSRFVKDLPAEHIIHVQANGTTTYQSPSTTTDHDINCGDRVFHQKFGYGEVIAREGERLEINFATSGPKKIMASFVEKAAP
jgi:DNA helicase-2/ATP-dependent DNA helicase PcrA